MKQFLVEIDRLVVDAGGIAPLQGERFRELVAQALQQRLQTQGTPETVAARESVTVSLGAPEQSRGTRLAKHVAQAIHQGLTRKA